MDCVFFVLKSQVFFKFPLKESAPLLYYTSRAVGTDQLTLEPTVIKLDSLSSSLSFSLTTFISFLYFLFLFFNLFLAVLGLRFCARAFSSCGKRGPLFIAVCGPLTVVASPVAEHRLQTRRLSSCGSGAQPLRGTWDPPGPGHEPVSPALADRFLTTAPPGKPSFLFMFTFVMFVANLSYQSKISVHFSVVSFIILFVSNLLIGPVNDNTFCLQFVSFICIFFSFSLPSYPFRSLVFIELMFLLQCSRE